MNLLHFGLVTPYSDINLSQNWLTHVTVCCLTAPSYCLNLCWFFFSGVLWYSPDSNFNNGTPHSRLQEYTPYFQSHLLNRRLLISSNTGWIFSKTSCYLNRLGWWSKRYVCESILWAGFHFRHLSCYMQYHIISDCVIREVGCIFPVNLG